VQTETPLAQSIRSHFRVTTMDIWLARFPPAWESLGSNEQGNTASRAKRFIGVIVRPNRTFEGIAQDPALPLGLLIFGISLALSVGLTLYLYSYRIHVGNLLQLPAPDPVGGYGGIVAPGVATPDYSAIATQDITFRLLFLLIVQGVAWLVAQVFKRKESSFNILLSAVSHAFAVMVVGAIIVAPLALIYPEQNNQVVQVTYERAVLSRVSFRGTFIHAASMGQPTAILSQLNSSRVDVSMAVSDQLNASEGESILIGLVIENVTVGGSTFNGNITVEKAVLSSIERDDWTDGLAVLNASRAVVSFGVIRDGTSYVWNRERAQETGYGWNPALPPPNAVDLLLWFIPLGLRLWIIGLGSIAMYWTYGVGVPTDGSIRARVIALLKLTIAPVAIVLLSLVFLPSVILSPY